MWLLTRKTLRKFWEKHKDAEAPLRAWLREVEIAEWTTFADVKATFNSADKVDYQTVFNVGGNKYRIIAVIDYQRHKVFTRFVLTHKEYDKEQWKNDRFGQGWA